MNSPRPRPDAVIPALKEENINLKRRVEELEDMTKHKGLVLTRKVGESIIIDGDIEVTLVEIRSKNAIFIRVDAPRHISINRKEVHDKINKETT